MTPAERLERTQWDFWWLPDDACVHQTDELTWIACERRVPYLNSVVRTRATADRAGPLLDAVRATTSHGDLRWMILDTWDSAPFARELVRRGFVPDHDGRAVILDTHAWSRRTRHEVRAASTLDEMRAASRVMNLGFSREDLATEAEIRRSLETATGPGARTRRFVAWSPEGQPVGHGGLNLFPALSMGLLWGGAVIEEARGRGVYGDLLDARIRFARTSGLRHVGMYARVDTSLPIVRAHGFEVVGEMAWLWDPAASPG